MATRRTAFVFLTSLIVIGLDGACEESSCPTNGCVPRLELVYRQPIAGSYLAAVFYQGATAIASCPSEGPAPSGGGIALCTGDRLLITGFDLGHAENTTVELTVSLNQSNPLPVTATLNGIANSRGCPLVCYDHRGTVPN